MTQDRIEAFQGMLRLVDSDGLELPWKPWINGLLIEYRTGCGGMSPPRWPVPGWMPGAGDSFDPAALIMDYFSNADDFTDPAEARKRVRNRSRNEEPSAGMADGTSLFGLPKASGVVAMIKSRFCGCIAAIYEYEYCFKGGGSCEQFPLELVLLIQQAVRYAMFLISIGGRRHVSEDELTFVHLLASHIQPLVSTPA